MYSCNIIETLWVQDLDSSTFFNTKEGHQHLNENLKGCFLFRLALNSVAKTSDVTSIIHYIVKIYFKKACTHFEFSKRRYKKHTAHLLPTSIKIRGQKKDKSKLVILRLAR